MANRIQLRRDTAANWTRVNPILEDGEPGLEIDTNQIKYGDGTTAWRLLAYATATVDVLTEWEYTDTESGYTSTANLSYDFNVDTDNSHLNVNGDGTWSLGSDNNSTKIYSPFTGCVSIQTDEGVYWTFTQNGTTSFPGNLYVGGNINNVDRISANSFVYANGVSILNGITTSGSTYSNANVASYLVSNPQAGTYSNSNVASYLVSNPQAGTYSNSNVASYLPTYSENIGGNIAKNGYTWTFAEDGTLSVPTGLSIGGSELYPLIDAPGELNVRSYSSVIISAEGGDYDWTFGNDGTLTLPSGPQLVSGYPGAGYVNDTATLAGAQVYLSSTDGTSFVGVENGVPLIGTVAGNWTFGTDGTTTFPDHGAVTVSGNLTVGNLTVNGNTTTINTQSYTVVDNIIQMAADNPADSLDLGFVAHRTVNGTLQHTGLVRDASTGIWELFSNVTTQPGTTVDFTQALLDDLQLDKLYADTVHLSGTPPSTNAGDEGDLAGDIHVDSNYLYYCTTNWSPSSYTVGWGGATSNTIFLVKGDYPTPQVGWTITRGAYTFTIDTVADESNWRITYTGTPYGEGAGGTATLTNPNPAVIWKTVPLNTFQTAVAGTYSNANVASYLTTQTFYSNANVASYLVANPQAGTYSNANVASYLVANPQAGTYSNSNVASYLVSGVSGDVKTSANVIAPNFLFANGVNILSTIGAGSYGNTEVAAYLPTYSGNVGAGNIVTTGATSGNISGANYISANAFQVSTGIFWANGTAWSSTSGGGTTYSNANVASYLTAGNISFGVAGFTVLPNIVAQFTTNVNSYGQVNMQNINAGTDATTEIVATANNGTDTIFFIDMGIAGNTYDNASPNNSLGTIIYANDAYLYAQGNTSANVGGNLAIGTSTAGRNVTIFAGGINNSSNVATFANTGVTVYGNITTSGTYGNISGANVISANTVTVTTYVRTQPVTFAALPSAVAAGAGARAFITDGNTATFSSQVSGSGANAVPVYSNGTNWYVG